MSIDEMTMEDMVAMFAMMGMLASGKGGTHVVDQAHRYADYFVKVKQTREQENTDEQV
jgi:hypothetical protein